MNNRPEHISEDLWRHMHDSDDTWIWDAHPRVSDSAINAEKFKEYEKWLSNQSKENDDV